MGSITVPMTSCLTGLDSSVLQIKTKIVSCHTADSKPVKQEVTSTTILPPLIFPGIRPKQRGEKERQKEMEERVRDWVWLEKVVASIRGNQLPVSAIRWQHCSQICFATFI